MKGPWIYVGAAAIIVAMVVMMRLSTGTKPAESFDFYSPPDEETAPSPFDEIAAKAGSLYARERQEAVTAIEALGPDDTDALEGLRRLTSSKRPEIKKAAEDAIVRLTASQQGD